MDLVRRPAVAGSFYPSDGEALRDLVDRLLQASATDAPAPRAVVAPHAGYVYSGPIAASAYARIRNGGDTVRRVVVVGPSHYVGFHGLAASSKAAFSTPLGDVLVDAEAQREIVDLPQVQVLDRAHAREHSIEVQLPFLQRSLGPVGIVPLAVGEATAEEVSAVLDRLWSGPETLIVVSSDLSHYLDYETARRLDLKTSRAIEELRPQDIGPGQACGRDAIVGLLVAARLQGLNAETIDLRNSGDTAGTREQVVGYGAYAFA